MILDESFQNLSTFSVRGPERKHSDEGSIISTVLGYAKSTSKWEPHNLKESKFFN